MPDLQPAIPAATLVIFRTRSDGPPELLMVERSMGMAFAAGALVFPGGRIDPGDHDLAAEQDGDPDDTAARIAAIRETIEEAGLPIGLEPQPAPGALVALREALHAGAPLRDALAAAGTQLALHRLTPFARWLPQHQGMRIFDTRFYLAELPADAPRASVDATENVRLLWASAAEVLAEADAGRATIIFPTRRNLERLAQFGSFADAAAHARAIPVRTITPFAEERGGRQHLCIPAGLGYPVTGEPMDDTVRG
ncbi:NUDIX hydrolase [Sphingomonas sp.]|uniref:NUDIX hydrolase n=1 Tax=Sphingomonas sp. TaxID=28214 RepID=UPI003CC5FD11